MSGDPRSPGGAAVTARTMPTRSAWHIGVGAVGASWLLTAVVVTLLGMLTPVDPWLPVHLLLLGAVSNAILVWSTYFTEALLRQPRAGRRLAEAVRLGAFNLGAVAVVLGMSVEVHALVVLGASLAIVAVGWHAVVLLRRIRRSLPSRFGATVHYYVAGSTLLLLGICLGVVLATYDLDDDTHARIALAHVTLNVLGWLGLTVLGTLVTLWPTMLHTQVVDGAERASRRALPVLVSAIVATAALALVGNQVLTALGLSCYLAGLVVAGRPLVEEAIHRRPSTYATWSVCVGVTWYAVTLVVLTAVVAVAPGWSAAAEVADRLAAPLLVGFGAQVLLGALSYLVPVVLGGGPAMSRRTIAILDTGARARLAVINVGVLAVVVPLPAVLREVLSVSALAALASFLPLVLRAVFVRREQDRARTAEVLS